MIMTEKFKILGKYIKDLSSETPNIETYLFVRDRISTYQLDIDINSKALKNKMIEIVTTFKFLDKEKNDKKAHFEVVYSTVIQLIEEIKKREELEKIILIEVQNKIYPDLEKALLDLLHNSGYPGVRFQKPVDFENLYKQKFN
tara:strand:- start:188 stop:616 length:429 start_codon:yes stop_codon:yes gene_type:complete